MAVKTYSYSKQKNVKISEHTSVWEMGSTSGYKIYSDKVLVDEKLMEMIEKLFAKLQCKKYLISSGYRTPEHDKAVGGSGTGQHTKGKAVDACFYDKNNKIIPAQIVCCVAQDLGFKGIANINRNYAYVHLDMRTIGTYKGDEIKGNSTVTKDFYDYFGITEADVAKYTGETKIAKITKGSKVKVRKGAKSYNGVKVASFVYNNVYTVDELNGKRAVLGKNSICTAFNVDDLILQ